MKKKSELSTVQGLIILLLIVIVVFFFTKTAIAYLKNTSDIEKCRLSVIAADKLRAGGKTLFDIDCPYKTTNLKYNDITTQGKIDTDKLNKKIAEEMKICWYKMGEGKLNDFNQGLLDITGTHTCIHCSTIIFDEQTKKLQPSIFPTLNMTWLKNNKMKDSETSYLDYFNSTDVLILPGAIYADRQYYIVFDSFKKGTAGNLLKDYHWVSPAYFIEYKLLESIDKNINCDNCAGLYLVSGDDVNSYCQTLFNKKE